jgi:hypothetical protein
MTSWPFGSSGNLVAAKGRAVPSVVKGFPPWTHEAGTMTLVSIN